MIKTFGDMTTHNILLDYMIIGIDICLLEV